jgi:GWxTD domain-containing protein
MKRIAAVVVISLCATTMFASGLSRTYKDWPKTPLGYFMTNEDKKQWAALQSDADAEQFIKNFITKRGGETFTNELAQNVAQADKYLTIGKTRGSETVRGKMMILLGPTVATAATRKKQSGDVHLAPGPLMGGEFSGPPVEAVSDAMNGPGNSTTFITEYTYVYPASALPAAYGKSLTVKIEVDPNKERDLLASYTAEKELDKVYEMVAQAKLAAAKPATP